MTHLMYATPSVNVCLCQDLHVSYRHVGVQVGRIVYGTSGVAPAPSYFSVEPSGEVRVLQDLTTDRALVYTVSASPPTEHSSTR